MNDQKVGNCLHLYLNNQLLLSALDDEGEQIGELSDDEKVLASFRERASDQAVALLENTFSSLLSNVGAVPYRSDRRSQRRTVRQNWSMEGRLYRHRERLARTYWNLHLGSLKDRGPSITYMLGPQDSSSVVPMDDLAALVAPVLEIESANPRQCFTKSPGIEAGVVAATIKLGPEQTHRDVAKALKEKLELFFAKFRTELEKAVEA